MLLRLRLGQRRAHTGLRLLLLLVLGVAVFWAATGTGLYPALDLLVPTWGREGRLLGLSLKTVPILTVLLPWLGASLAISWIGLRTGPPITATDVELERQRLRGTAAEWKRVAQTLRWTSWAYLGFFALLTLGGLVCLWGGLFAADSDFSAGPSDARSELVTLGIAASLTGAGFLYWSFKNLWSPQDVRLR